MRLRLRVIASVDPRHGGPIEGIRQQAPFHASAGVEEHVVSLDPPDAPWVKDFPLKVFACGEPMDKTSGGVRRPWHRYGYCPAFIPWLKAHTRDYDVVTVHGLWNFSTMGARAALVGADVPYLVMSHGMLDPWFKRNFPLKGAMKQALWWFNEGPLVNNARAVLFTSEEERILARQSFTPYRAKERVVAYGTSDPGPLRPGQTEAFRALVPNLRRPYLLYLSRIHPKKGCDLLIDAFAEIARDGDGVDLVMAGPVSDDYFAELKALAEQRGIADRIHWPGMLRGDAKWGGFHGCEAFVLPSHQENFGIVVAEAMACAKPVFITNKVNIWREVTAGGGFADEDDRPGVVRLLRRFAALSLDERQVIGERARAIFLSSFEVSRAAEDLNNACRDAMAGRT